MFTGHWNSLYYLVDLVLRSLLNLALCRWAGTDPRWVEQAILWQRRKTWHRWIRWNGPASGWSCQNKICQFSKFSTVKTPILPLVGVPKKLLYSIVCKTMQTRLFNRSMMTKGSRSGSMKGQIQRMLFDPWPWSSAKKHEDCKSFS